TIISVIESRVRSRAAPTGRGRRRPHSSEGATPMRSEMPTQSETPKRSPAQQEASRRNGARGKGPLRPETREKVKFNGLKHGLRAEQVVLPGEDPAEFEAEVRAWFDDYDPQSHTRAVLCRRAAEASWR